MNALAAAAELELRRRRRTFGDWCKVVSPTFSWDWDYLKFIRDKLQPVIDGKPRKIILCIPPRHGKSEQVTVRLPAFMLEKDPTKRVCVAAYSQTFVNKFSRKIRRIAESRITLSQERNAVEEWETEQGGSLRAVGVGGGVTGQGFDLIIVDDPIKSREEANSETFRNKVWDWFTDDLYTRQEPGCSIIIIQTRWHEDDLAGRILESDFADEWELINLPAEAEANDSLGRELGEPLCADRYDTDALNQLKTVLGSSYYALFQQRPQPEGGSIFKREWFQWYDELPKVNKYITNDFAVSQGDGDFTEHAVWGVDNDENIYAVDWWSGQESPDKWIDALLSLAKQHKPLAVFSESGVIRKSIEPFLLKSMREQKVFFRQEWLTRTADKIASSTGFQGRASCGKVFLPRGKQWAQDLLDQLLRFPSAKHDDKVDACSLLGMALDQTHAAVAKPKAAPKRDRWADDYESNNWKTA